MLVTILTVGILSCSTTAKTSGGVSIVAEGRSQLSPEKARLYDYFFLEAMIQRQKGQNDAAFDLLNHCLEINPHAAEAYFFMAQYYSALKQAEKSLDYFQTAARLNPQNETYMETLAQVYIRQQNYQDAIRSRLAPFVDFPITKVNDFPWQRVRFIRGWATRRLQWKKWLPLPSNTPTI